jgi:hypothetical protein
LFTAAAAAAAYKLGRVMKLQRVKAGVLIHCLIVYAPCLLLLLLICFYAWLAGLGTEALSIIEALIHTKQMAAEGRSCQPQGLTGRPIKPCLWL